MANNVLNAFKYLSQSSITLDSFNIDILAEQAADISSMEKEAETIFQNKKYTDDELRAAVALMSMRYQTPYIFDQKTHSVIPKNSMADSDIDSDDSEQKVDSNLVIHESFSDCSDNSDKCKSPSEESEGNCTPAPVEWFAEVSLTKAPIEEEEFDFYY